MEEEDASYFDFRIKPAALLDASLQAQSPCGELGAAPCAGPTSFMLVYIPLGDAALFTGPN